MHILLSDLIKDTPLMKESRKKEEEKSSSPGGIHNHNLQIMRCVLYRCATTPALRVVRYLIQQYLSVVTLIFQKVLVLNIMKKFFLANQEVIEDLFSISKF